MQGALARTNAALGADRAVKLVFNLQKARGELNELPVALQTVALVGAVGLSQGTVERAGIGRQAVVGHLQGCLGVALVAKPPHAKAGGVGQGQGVRSALAELVRAAPEKAFIDRRGRAKEVQKEPGVAPKISNQVEVAPRAIRLIGRALPLFLREPGPKGVGQGKVVVNTGDGLHGPPVAYA